MFIVCKKGFQKVEQFFANLHFSIQEICKISFLHMGMERTQNFTLISNLLI
jgi:hypothetical protein